MKDLKKISFLLLIVAFITSCNNENDFYEEQTSNDQMSNKGLLNAKTALDADSFGDELDAVSGATIQGYDFSASSYNLENNDFYFNLYEYFGYNQYIEIKAMDYNTMDGLVYFIGENNGDESKAQKNSSSSERDSSERYLYSLEKETEEVNMIGLLSSYDYDLRTKSDDLISPANPESEYLGKAHDLTFDADGNLYVAYKSGKIMKYDLETNEMDEFVDLDDYEFYVGADAVGFTYDFDNDRLLYSSYEFEDEYIEGFWNYYYDSVFLGINCSTAAVSELFTLRNPVTYNSYSNYAYYYANTTNMDYIGDNKIVYSEWWGYGIFHAVDVISGEYVFTVDDESSFYAKDLMYIKNTDYDNDGVLNEDDPYPYSNMSEYVSIDGCYPDIENIFVEPGATMMDQIDELIAEINEQYNGKNYDELHRDFTRGISKITYYWRKDRLITRGERSDISSCAWSANIPYFNEPR